MKYTSLYLILLSVCMMIGLANCNSSKEPSALVAQCERLNGDFRTVAEESPMFLDSLTCNYGDAKIAVGVVLADTVDVAAFDQAFVEYVVAQYLKSHADENLAVILNTLGDEKGSLTIAISTPAAEKAVFEISAARLKQLYKLPNSELNFAEARTVACKLFESHCSEFAKAVKANTCEFSFSGGFAQYTLIFPTAQAFANQSQGSLQGRYRSALQPQYEGYGYCRTFVMDVFKSLGFDGYRFVYTDEAGTKEIKTAIPWRFID